MWIRLGERCCSTCHRLGRHRLGLAFTEPHRTTDYDPQAFRGGFNVMCVLISVHPLREVDAIGADAFLVQLPGQLLGRRPAGGIPVVGDQYPFGVVFLEGHQVIGGQAFHTITGGDIAIPRAPEGQGIDEGFAQDDFR